MGAAEPLRARQAALRQAIDTLADPVRAEAQQRYMKSAMAYRGVAMGDVRRIVQDHVRAAPCSSQDEMLALARLLWNDATYREERYVALAVCRHPRHHRFQDARCLDTYRDFIVDGAWWDLVDETSRLVGELLDTDEDGVRERIRGWATGDDMWLRRAAIICQRHRGARADVDLLVRVVTPNLADREFFIRKAIGWALRQHARVDPEWVRRFVQSHEMSGLSRREALKHLDGPEDVAN